MIKVKIKKNLKEFEINVDFLAKENFISIFGKSGSGKTTVLRCIAGLEKPNEGEISFNNQVWFSSKEDINLPPQKRSIGFVFQQPTLFPNMSVEENIRFAMSKKDENLFEKLISIANIGKLLNRKPQNLSGGEKQKISLIRAIARKPKLLLLDEPFTALDFETKFEIYEELKILSKEIGFYTILVSHDIFEVLNLTERVFYIDKGKIIKTGKPKEILPVKKYIDNQAF